MLDAQRFGQRLQVTLELPPGLRAASVHSPSNLRGTERFDEPRRSVEIQTFLLPFEITELE